MGSWFHHTPLALFLLQAVVIVAASRGLSLLARRMGQAPVVAEIAAGILLGPSILGWLAPGWHHALFPAESLPPLQMLAQLGLVVFMFLIGMELDLRSLRQRATATLFISHAAIALPFALGVAVTLALPGSLAPPEADPVSTAIFMGVAMSITAFPVLARILAERGLMRTPLGSTALACAAVDDVTAWCLLALVVSRVRADSATDALVTTALAGVLVVVMLFGTRRGLARLGTIASDRESLTPGLFGATLVGLLLSAVVAEWIGIHALFGAFLMGVCMPRNSGFSAAVADKLEDVVTVFLLPLFFAMSGLQTEIRLLDSWSHVGLCALLIAVACAGKLIAVYVAARMTGIPGRDAGALAVLMNTRGLMELVVLNVGLQLQVLTPRAFTMMVVMALFTTWMTTPIMRWLDRDGSLSRARSPRTVPTVLPSTSARLAAIPTNENAFAGAAVTGRMGIVAPPGFSVLVGVGQVATAGPMLELAGLLGARTPDRLHTLHAFRPADRTSMLVHEPEKTAEGLLLLGAIHDLARRHGVEATTALAVDTPPAEAIADASGRAGVDLTLLGWHRPLINDNILGGVVAEVLAQSRTPLGILLGQELVASDRVTAFVSETPSGVLARKLAFRLAFALGAELQVVEAMGAGSPAQRTVEPIRDPEYPTVRAIAVSRRLATSTALALEELGTTPGLVIVAVDGSWDMDVPAISLATHALLRRLLQGTTLLVRTAQPQNPA